MTDANIFSVGENATVTGAQSFALGNGATVTGSGSSAVGFEATATGADSRAIGPNTSAFGAGAQATAPNSTALGANSVANEANTVSVGSSGNERRVTNVADGIHDFDAVNMRQLNALFTRIDRAGASAAALSGLAPLDYDPEQPTQISMAAGTYNGEQALAIGVYHYTKKDVMLNAGFSISGGEKMGRVGVTWRTGGKKSKEIVRQDASVPAMALAATAPAATQNASGSRLLKLVEESQPKADE